MPCWGGGNTLGYDIVVSFPAELPVADDDKGSPSLLFSFSVVSVFVL